MRRKVGVCNSCVVQKAVSLRPVWNTEQLPALVSTGLYVFAYWFVCFHVLVCMFSCTGLYVFAYWFVCFRVLVYIRFVILVYTLYQYKICFLVLVYIRFVVLVYTLYQYKIITFNVFLNCFIHVSVRFLMLVYTLYWFITYIGLYTFYCTGLYLILVYNL